MGESSSCVISALLTVTLNPFIDICYDDISMITIVCRISLQKILILLIEIIVNVI